MIDAMKIAKDALECTEAVGGPLAHKKRKQAITALRAAIEAAERAEPVAWLVYAGVCDMHPVYPPYKNKEAAKIVASEIKSVTEVRPLYAHPPAITDKMVEQAARVSDAEYRRLLFGFMLDCNAIGLSGAAENLHKSMKQADVARAIEREATAEAVRIMREWREAFLAWRAYGASPEGNMQDLDALYRSMDRAAQACVAYLERMK